MKFDSNRAWNEAVALVGAARALAWPVAGVFFLVPGLASLWLLADFRANMASVLVPGADPKQVLALLDARFWITVLVLSMVQAIGNLALLGVLANPARPTVGEAIGSAVRALPTVIGLFVMALTVGTLGLLVISLPFGMLIAATGLKTPFLVLMGLTLFYFVVRLSLISPIIAVDGLRAPVQVAARSWRLTQGNAGRIYAFYLLLAAGYVVISAVVQVVMALLLGIGAASGGNPLAEGSAAMTAVSLVSGLIGMVVAVLLNAVLASVHRQVASS